MSRFTEAKFTIRAINKTQKTFAQIGQSVDKMDKRFGKLDGSLNKIGGLMATAFVGKQITDTITKFKKLEASLRTVAGGAENAKIAFGFIQDFAATTPFQLEEVTGCDKTKTSRKNKFNNFINFRGFPDIPGNDKILKTSGTMDRE